MSPLEDVSGVLFPNAVIEGCSNDYSKIMLKFCSLPEVPSKKGRILSCDDSFIFFSFISNTNNDVRRRNIGRGYDGSHLRIPDVDIVPGLLFPLDNSSEMPHYLCRPRSIILSDGRVFLREKLERDKDYVSALPRIVEAIRGLVRSSKFLGLYNGYMIPFSK